MKPSIETLVDTYQNSLYTAAFSVCRNVQDAEDAVQDTFLQYLSQRDIFQSPEHLRAWLLRVAINKAKNKCTAFFRRNTLPLEDYIETLVFPTEEASGLFETVMKLPEAYRIVIHLYYYEEYSVKEIAGILKITPETVRVRLSRGRAKLRETLKEEWENDE